MPTPLTNEHLAELEEFAQAGDRIGYYGTLAEHGYQYGQLAEGVVTGSQMEGRTANEFFLGQAEDQIEARNEQRGLAEGQDGWVNPELANDDMAQMSQKLMEADFALRRGKDSASRNGAREHVDDIQEYHEEVFAEHFNVTLDAWTPQRALENRDTPEARDELWQEMLDKGADPIMMAGGTAKGDYGTGHYGAGMRATFSGEGSVGPYRTATPRGDGQVIAGSGGADKPVRGSAGHDVIMTFRGNDVVDAGGGHDRIYSGAGHDVISGGAGNDSINPGTGNDRINGGVGIDKLDYSRGRHYATDEALQDFNMRVGGHTGAYTYMDPETYRYDVEISGDRMTVNEPALTTQMGFSKLNKRSTDIAEDMEHYSGSPISDFVTLRDTTESLYLDGGGGADTLTAKLPANVRANTIFDDTDGVIPKGHIHQNLPYDGRLQMPDGTTVYYFDFEETNFKGIREGTITDGLPRTTQETNANEHMPDARVPVPLKRLIETLRDDYEPLRDSLLEQSAAGNLGADHARILTHLNNPHFSDAAQALVSKDVDTVHMSAEHTAGLSASDPAVRVITAAKGLHDTALEQGLVDEYGIDKETSPVAERSMPLQVNYEKDEDSYALI